MHVYHPNAEIRGRLTGSGHRIRDVVVLEVEKDVEAARLQPLDESRSRPGKQFIAYLQPAQRRIQPGDNALGGFHIGIIEGNNDPVPINPCLPHHSPSMPMIGLTVFHSRQLGHCQWRILPS